MNEYSGYRGRSLGRILGHLYELCGSQVAENVTVDEHNIYLYGKLFATYTWEKEHEYFWPKFDFTDPEMNTRIHTIKYEDYEMSDVVEELLHQNAQMKSVLEKTLGALEEEDWWKRTNIKHEIKKVLEDK